MKIWKFTLRKSSGVKNTLRQSQSLQSFPSDKFWENETLQLTPGDRQRGSAKKNIDTLTFDVCLFPAYSSVSPWSPTTSFSRTSPGFPDSPRPYPQEIFLQGHMEVDRNGKMSSGRTYNWHSICLRWGDLITLFSDTSWNSNTWLSIGGFTSLIHFYVLIINLMKLSASNDISMIFQGTVEERNSKFPHFKTLLSLTCLHTNTLKFYSLLFNFIKFTIYYGNYEKISSWKENHGEFTYVLRYLTKYSWWIHLPPSASIILHSWFK